MSDEQERDLERRARTGDVEAGVQLVRMLERRGATAATQEGRGALDALEDAAGTDPDPLLAILRALPEDMRPAQTTRLARLDNGEARSLLREWWPDLSIVLGTNHRSSDDVEEGFAALRAAPTHVWMAAVLIALHRIRVMLSLQGTWMPSGGEWHHAALRRLASDLLRRRAVYSERDLAHLVRCVGAVRSLDDVPWRGILQAVERHVKRNGLGAALRTKLSEAFELRRSAPPPDLLSPAFVEHLQRIEALLGR